MILKRTEHKITGTQLPVKSRIRLLIIAALIIVFPAVAMQAAGNTEVPDKPSLADIKVTFKLDPKLTRSLYMGDRWVSPATYNSTSVRKGETITVWVRAIGFDDTGKTMIIHPQWIPGDPDVVAVSPGQRGEARIIIKNAGKSSLKIVSEEISKTLTIRATHRGDTIQASISQ